MGEEEGVNRGLDGGGGGGGGGGEEVRLEMEMEMEVEDSFVEMSLQVGEVNKRLTV